MRYFIIFCATLALHAPLHPAAVALNAEQSGANPGNGMKEKEVMDILDSQMRQANYKNALILLDQVAQEEAQNPNGARSTKRDSRNRIATHIKRTLKYRFSGDNSSIPTSTQDLHRNKLRSQLADLEMKGVISPHLSHEIKEELNDDTQPPSPFATLSDKHGGDLGMLAYHGGDGLLKMQQDQARARALTKKTPAAVWEGFKSHDNLAGGALSLPSVAGGIRNMAFSTYGLIPFIHTDDWKMLKKSGWENNPAHHSALSKRLAGAHLATRGANVLFDLATKSGIHLTPKQARALAYHNRRHGAPKELKKFKDQTKTLAKVRLALRVLGLGMIPVTMKDKNHGEKNTNRGLAIANTAGALDSLLGIADRMRTRRAISRLKKRLPNMQQELAATPPTQQELQEDQFAAADASGGAADMNMNAMFNGIGDSFSLH